MKTKSYTSMKWFKSVVSLCFVIILGFGIVHFFPRSAANQLKAVTTSAGSRIEPMASPCTTDAGTGDQLLVSISRRHLWACADDKQVYDSAVVTGMENLPADLTPTGTYHIYAKYTDQYLKGSDSTGSWDDYVYYWMPFLNNQYGIYGLHDATWRNASDFGSIDPYSSNASHGCVELPLATAKWLYNWAAIGTTVIISS